MRCGTGCIRGMLVSMTSKDVLTELSEDGVLFGPFRLEGDGTLWCKENIVHLTPKELIALQFLIAHTGRIVTPLQLKHALWGDVHVTADSVPRCLSSLRSKLNGMDCIQTVYKRGYRFSPEIHPLHPQPGNTLPRLAILPFSCGYAVPEHLGRALAEETIVRLVNLPHPVVSVLARDSVASLVGNKMTAQQVGETLHADLALTGTLTAMTAHYRLRAEMIRIADETQIWVEDFLIPLGTTDRVETHLVQRLLVRLNMGLTAVAAATSTASERHPIQREAWELYLRGHQEGQSMQRHRMQDAMQHLQQALAIDPTLTEARIDIAYLGSAQSLYGFLSPRAAASEVRRIAESFSGRAEIPEAVLPALGWQSFHVDHDTVSALDAFERSAHLPHSLWTTHLRFLFSVSRHHFEDAATLIREALEADPFSPCLHAWLAWNAHLAGNAEESVELANKAINLFPTHETVVFYCSLILSAHDRVEDALELAHNMYHRATDFDMAAASHAYALVRAGHSEDGRNMLERLQWMSRERFVMSSFLPAIHVALGDIDSAIADLRTAQDERCPWFFQMLADSRLQELHGHPAFEEMRAILRRMEEKLPNHRESEMELCAGD